MLRPRLLAAALTVGVVVALTSCSGGSPAATSATDSAPSTSPATVTPPTTSAAPEAAKLVPSGDAELDALDAELAAAEQEDQSLSDAAAEAVSK